MGRGVPPSRSRPHREGRAPSRPQGGASRSRLQGSTASRPPRHAPPTAPVFGKAFVLKTDRVQTVLQCAPCRAPKAKHSVCHWLSASHKPRGAPKACERQVLRSILSSAIPVALCGAFAHRWCATGRARQNCWRTHQRQVIAEPLARGLRGAEGLAHTPLAVTRAPLPLRPHREGRAPSRPQGRASRSRPHREGRAPSRPD